MSFKALCLVLALSHVAASPPILGIVNGDLVTSADDFPFAALQYSGDVTTGEFCGGVLISDQWVLTAGHCLYDTKAQEMKAHVQFHRDDYDKSIKTEGGVDRGLAEYAIHPKYSKNSWEYDLALLKLASPVTTTPAVLDDGSKDWSGMDAVVVGWGSQDVACTKYDSKLRRGNVTIATEKQCIATTSGGQYYDKDLVICAGKQIRRLQSGPGAKWVETGCGDSGGPLLVKSDGKWTVVGIVSYGDGNTWDVYMRPYGNLDWINQMIHGSSGASTVVV